MVVKPEHSHTGGTHTGWEEDMALWDGCGFVVLEGGRHRERLFEWRYLEVFFQRVRERPPLKLNIHGATFLLSMLHQHFKMLVGSCGVIVR